MSGYPNAQNNPAGAIPVWLTSAPPSGVVGVTRAVSASGNVSALVLAAAPANFYQAHAENLSDAQGFLVVYDAVAAPSAGALTPGLVLDFRAIGPHDSVSIDHVTQPYAATAGVVLLLTSAVTPFTYTTGSLTGALVGFAQ